MKFILFSDLHGRILLSLKLVARFQKERNIKIDKILQCGDVGIFPFLDRLDKATIRHAKKDPSELGFEKYFFKHSTDVEKLIRQINAEMICVRGNHEDHEFLDSLEAKSPENRYFFDYYKSLSMCKSGTIQTIGNLNIVGIGRIGCINPKRAKEQIHIQAFEKKEVLKTINSKANIDILISHDSPLDFVTLGYGMDEIEQFLGFKKPRLHFFGHTGTPFKIEKHSNGITDCIKIAELEFTQSQILPYGSMIYLDYSNTEPIIEVIHDKWFLEYQSNNWMYV